MAHTPKFRVSYPSVFKPRKNDLNGKDEYSVQALFAPGENLDKLKEAAKAACEKKWGKDATKWPPNLRSPFRDQADRAKKNEKGDMVLPEGYVAGAKYLNLKSERKPGVVDGQVQPILDQTHFYAGCYAIAVVEAYAYDQKGNRGVSFGLQHLQKVADGEPFGNRVKVEDAFAPISASTEGGAAAPASAGGIFD